MALKQKIQEDLKTAIHKKEELELLVLRMTLAVLHNREIEKKAKLRKEGRGEGDIEKEGQLSDEEVAETIFSEVKKRKEAILEFSAHGGLASGEEKDKINKFIDKEKKEVEILQKYLPEQLSEEDLKKLVKEAIEKVGAKEIKDMGRVMSEIMPKVKGKAEGGLVNKVVKESLS